MKLLFLDTETTGNEVAKDRLCQICYKTKDGIRTEYFKPPIPISTKSSSITHITNKMVEDKPPFQGSEMKKELEILLTDHVLIAHNAKFDIAILENEDLKVPNSICTLRIARHLDTEAIIPEYNLQFLRYYLDLEVDGGAHDAEGDVKVLEAIFNRQFQKIKSEGLSDDEAITKMIKISNTPTLYKKFNFGKHKDEFIVDVAKTDRGYLEWLLKQKTESDETDEDWIYTLNHHLGRLV